MRATIMFGAGNVRIENIPDPQIIEPTDAVVVVSCACICGSDLWPYKGLEEFPETGRRMVMRRSVSSTQSAPKFAM
jgi:threonine dehydrogenase-like Zn-dependent dehydrogenase